MNREKYVSVPGYREGYDQGVIDGRRQGLDVFITFMFELSQLCDRYKIYCDKENESEAEYENNNAF